jgi:MFS-type transporter involved in bile tolerance (Atg22 family)
VDNRQPKRREPLTDASITLRSAVAAAVAAALGAIAGGMAASKLPSDKFIWTGFALAPLLILLEVFFKHFVALFGGNSNAARFTLAGALVAGFYVTWFAVRSL